MHRSRVRGPTGNGRVLAGWYAEASIVSSVELLDELKRDECVRTFEAQQMRRTAKLRQIPEMSIRDSRSRAT